MANNSNFPSFDEVDSVAPSKSSAGVSFSKEVKAEQSLKPMSDFPAFDEINTTPPAESVQMFPSFEEVETVATAPTSPSFPSFEEVDAAQVLPTVTDKPAFSAPALQTRLARKQDLIGKLEYLQKNTPDDTPDEEGMTLADRRSAVESSGFNVAPEDLVSQLSSGIERRYQQAVKSKGFLSTTGDALKRGYESTGSMIYGGAKVLAPGELTAEDKDLLRAGAQASREYEIQNPRVVGGVQNIRGVGDAAKFAIESVAENLPRALPAVAGGLVGGIVAGPPGAMVGAGLAGLAQNTGEAIQDQANEGRDLSKGYAIAQGAGYSLVDAVIGGEANVAMRMARGIAKPALEMAKKEFVSSLKDVGKAALKTGLLEGVSEPLQSQGVKRALDYKRFGSAKTPDEKTTKEMILAGVNESVGAFLSGLFLGGAESANQYRGNVKLMRDADKAIGDLAMDADVAKMNPFDKTQVARYVVGRAQLNDLNTRLDTENLPANRKKIQAAIDQVTAAMDEIENVADDETKTVLNAWNSQYTKTSLANVPSNVAPTFTATADQVDAQMEDAGNGTQIFTDKNSGIAIVYQPISVMGVGKTRQITVVNNNGLRMPHGDNTFDTIDEAVEFAKDLSRLNSFRVSNNAAKAKFISSLTAKSHPGANLVQVDSPAQIENPEARARMLGGEQAFYSPDDNTVYAILDAIDSPAQAAIILNHENFHAAFESMLKAQGKTRAQVLGTNDKGRQQTVEEILASIGERTFRDMTRIEKATSAIESWIQRTTGVKTKVTQADIRLLVQQVRDHQKTIKGAGKQEYQADVSPKTVPMPEASPITESPALTESPDSQSKRLAHVQPEFPIQPEANAQPELPVQQPVGDKTTPAAADVQQPAQEAAQSTPTESATSVPVAEQKPMEAGPYVPRVASNEAEAEQTTSLTGVGGKQYPTVEIPLDELSLSKDVPQFKENADSATGEVEPIEGQKYERVGTAPIVVWERTDGRKEIITGRHRAAFARRVGEKSIPAQVVREVDGFTKSDAITFDAESNIRDGQGSVKDYANYFRNTNTDLQEASGRGLLGRDKGRKGFSIGKYASDDLYSVYRDGKINDSKAAAISESAPNNPGVQQVGIRYAEKHNAEETRQYMRSLQSMRPPEQSGQQLDLLGFDTSWQETADNRASAAVRITSRMNEELSALKAAKSLSAEKRNEIVKKYGVKAGNEKAIAKRIEDLTLQVERFKNWHLNPDLVKMVAEEAGEKASEESAVPVVNTPPADTKNNGSLFDEKALPFNLEGGTQEDVVRIAEEKKAEENRQAEDKRKLDAAPVLPGIDSHVVANEKPVAEKQNADVEAVEADSVEEEATKKQKELPIDTKTGEAVGEVGDEIELENGTLGVVEEANGRKRWKITRGKRWTIDYGKTSNQGWKVGDTVTPDELADAGVTFEQAGTGPLLSGQPVKIVGITRGGIYLVLPVSSVEEEAAPAALEAVKFGAKKAFEEKTSTIPRGTKAVATLPNGTLVSGEVKGVAKDGKVEFRAFKVRKFGSKAFTPYPVNADGTPGFKDSVVDTAKVRPIDAAADVSKLSPEEKRKLKIAEMRDSVNARREIRAGEQEAPKDIVDDFNNAKERKERRKTDNGVRFRRGNDQVNTPEFRKWFGDSKVVDADGEPMRLYHATNADFTEFDIQRAGGVGGAGVYMTDKPPQDDRYGNAVYPLYASISRPADFSKGQEAIDDMAESLGMKRLTQLRTLPEMKDWSQQLRTKLIAKGYDGARVMGERNGESFWVAFRPEQVKSATGNVGSFDATNADIRFRRVTPEQDAEPVFFSQLRRTLEAKMPNRMTVMALRGLIDPSRSGVKADEIEWTGLREFLDGKNPGDFVTKAEVLEAVRDVEIQEVVKGASDRTSEVEAWWNDEGGANEEKPYSELTPSERMDAVARYIDEVEPYTEDATKFSQYQLAGGENYRELMLTLPRNGATARVGDWAVPSAHRYGEDMVDTRRLVHIRFNERQTANGDKTLFLEEVQSDWHQAGREKGYASTEIGVKDDMAKRYFGKGYTELSAEDKSIVDETYKKPEMRGKRSEGVPDAPFKDTSKGWARLAFKRMLRWAAENGFDRVAWTTGEQQAERYDLSKQIDSVKYEYAPPHDARPSSGYDVTAVKDGREIFTQEGLDENGMAGVVGKELARKIVEDAKAKANGARVVGGSFSGLDLKVGGEGMRTFYDQILPSIANDIGKKFGARAEDVTVNAANPDEEVRWSEDTDGVHTVEWGSNSRKFADETEAKAFVDGLRVGKTLVHSLPVTPAMRESVMQGQPRFRRAVTPELDADYLLATEAGDRGGDNLVELLRKTAKDERDKAVAAWLERNPETAGRLEKMVVDRASAAGYKHGPLWHASAEAFNVFRRRFMRDGLKTAAEADKILRFGKGIFFSSDESVARNFGGINRRFFLKIDELYESNLGGVDYFYGKGYDAETGEPWIGDNGEHLGVEKAHLPDEMAEANLDDSGTRNTGVVVRGVYESIPSAGNPKPLADTWVVGNPTQIKSADPVTYDDAGRIIPPSERFNEKNNDIRFRRAVTPEEDKEYLSAVEAGDMDAAQRMVDEAAKAAGYNVGPVWHGDRTEGVEHLRWVDGGWRKVSTPSITSYSRTGKISNTQADGTYFTNDQKYAAGFGGQVRRFYLRINNPYIGKRDDGDVYDRILRELLASPETEKRAMLDPFGDGSYDPYNEIGKFSVEKFDATLRANFPKAFKNARRTFSAQGLSSDEPTFANTLTYAIAERLPTPVQFTERLQGEGHDAQIDPQITGQKSGTNQIVVFDSNQIKSADPVTYDDAGNVIPLSERFNEASDDIRFRRTGVEMDADYLRAVERGDTETAQRMVDEAAKRAGYDRETFRGDSMPDDIVVYDPRKRREVGVFTTPVREIADVYAEGGRLSNTSRRFYVRAPKVLDLTKDTLKNMLWVENWSKSFDEWIDRQTGEEMSAWDILQGGLMFDYEGDWSTERWGDLQATAQMDGYDAVVLPDYDNGLGVFPSLVVFDSNNLKLADPVTYDDAGRIIPPSERFNDKNNDIRYRRSDASVDKLMEEVNRQNVADNFRALPSTDPKAREIQADVQVSYAYNLTRKTVQRMQDEARGVYEKNKAQAQIDLLAGKTDKDSDDINTDARRMAQDKIAVDDLTMDAVANPEDYNKTATAMLGIWRWYERGTDVARALRLRFDPVDTPEGRRAWILRTMLAPTRKEAAIIKRAKTTAEAIEGLKIRAKNARKVMVSLKAKNIDISKLTASQLMDEAFVAKIMQEISTARSGWGDIVHEWWRNAILSAPTTQIVNMVGNAGHAALEGFIQRPVEALINTVAKNDRAASLRSVGAMYRAIIPSLNSANKAFLQSWKTEKPVSGDSAKVEESNAAIPTKFGGKIIRTPQRIMMAVDEWFKTVFMAMLTADYATREFDRLVKEGKQKESNREDYVLAQVDKDSASYAKAWEETLRWSFQQKPGHMAGAIMNWRNDPTFGFLLKFIFPFVKTPANIISTGIRKTPLNALPYIYKAATGKYSKEDAFRLGAEQAVGMVFMSVLYGMMEGDDDDPLNRPRITGSKKTTYFSPAGEKEAEAQDYPPMSVRVGDKWVSYARLEPFATMVSTMVDALTAWKQWKDGKTADIPATLFASIRGNFSDKTFLQGVGNMVNIIEGDEFAISKAATGTLAGFNPNIIRSTVRAFDPYVRDTKANKGFVKKLSYQIMPSEGNAPSPKIDKAGQPVKKEGGGVYNSLVPFRVQSADKTTKIDAMVKRYNESVPKDDRWWPSTPSPITVRLGKEKIELTPEEFETYKRYAGDISQRRLKSVSFNFDAPTESDMERLKKVYAKARDIAKDKIRPSVIRRFTKSARD